MSHVSTSQASDGLSAAFRQYYDLTKPRVVMLIVFTAIVGMLLAVQGIPNLFTVLMASLGIGLAASSGAAMNQIIDMRADAVMARTQGRPLATGGMQVWRAIVFAAVLCILGMLVLMQWVNTLTAILTFISMVGIRRDLYGIFKACNATKYCYWWRSRRGPTITGLGSNDQCSDSGSMPFVSNYFRLDATTFLGLSLISSRRVCQGWSANVACYTWRRVYSPANIALYLYFGRRYIATVYYPYVWRNLFISCFVSKCALYVFCFKVVPQLQ